MKREWWVGLILFVAFVAPASYYLNTGGPVRPQRKPAGRLDASLVNTDVASPNGSNASEASGRQGPIHWGRNPFLTPEEEATGGRPGAKGLDVKTIIVGENRSVASLGGYTVSVGESIGEERVVEIRSHAVVLERNGRRRVIRAAELYRISAEIGKTEKQNNEVHGQTANGNDLRKEVIK